MVGHTLRQPEILHSTILEGMTERKQSPGQPRNSFIRQIKNDAGVGNYKKLKEVMSVREEGELQTNLRVEKKKMFSTKF